VLRGAAGTARLTLARNRDPSYAQGVQLLLDGGLTVAAIGGPPPDDRGQQRRIGGKGLPTLSW
jgi:hypothetical protein